MAKVEMDLTEFNLMQENKVLLAEALKKQETLSETIDKLNKEKIALLESNEKLVTIKNVSIKKEVKLSYLPIEEISINLRNAINIHHLRSAQDIYDYIDTFFKTETEEVEETPVITTKGLHEIKKEIRQEEAANIDATTKRKLKELDVLVEEKQEWNNRLNKVRKDYRAIQKLSDGMMEQTKKDQIKIKNLKESLEELEMKSTRILDIPHIIRSVKTSWRTGASVKAEILKKLWDDYSN